MRPRSGARDPAFHSIKCSPIFTNALFIFNLMSIKKFNILLPEIHLVTDAVYLKHFSRAPLRGRIIFFSQNPGSRLSNLASARLRANPGLTTPTLFEGRFAAQHTYHDAHCWKDTQSFIRRKTTRFCLLEISRIIGCQPDRHGINYRCGKPRLAKAEASFRTNYD